ncbi:MAG: DUF4139 domain-containing protein [Chloroflexota bacterium]
MTRQPTSVRALFALFVGLLLVALLPAGAHAQDDEDESEPGVAVTVYNQGTALVRDRRTFELSEGMNTVDFTDVASAIDATSVSFVSLTDPDGTLVLEQNYVYDLVNSSALLERYIDQEISITTDDGTTYQGVLLSGRNGDIILREGDGAVVVIAVDSARDIRFPALPDGLITRPTLRWLVFSAMTGAQEVELTYLTRGINWTADYNILLRRADESLDLNGWVTLNNTSGTSYQDARLKLVAGDVNRLPEEVMMRDFEVEEMAMSAAPPAGVEQREFFEYQLYEVGRLVTIGDNETKQVEFVTATAVPAATYYVYDGSPPNFGYHGPITDPGYGMTGVQDVQNYLEFSTGEDNGLGADLPAGRVRVYQEDVDGAALLIGENSIDHTPQGEMVSLYLGNAFDLVGERVQTDFELLSETVLRETYEIRLRNRKDDETVEIRVPERMMRWSNWEILEADAEYDQIDSASIEFRVEVPPGEERVITYTVMYTWPR